MDECVELSCTSLTSELACLETPCGQNPGRSDVDDCIEKLTSLRSAAAAFDAFFIAPRQALRPMPDGETGRLSDFRRIVALQRRCVAMCFQHVLLATRHKAAWSATSLVQHPSSHDSRSILQQCQGIKASSPRALPSLEAYGYSRSLWPSS